MGVLVEETPPERDKLGLVSGGWYAESLEPYLETFGDNLLVLCEVLNIDMTPHATNTRRKCAEVAEKYARP